ncbi:hypothetical protein SAMN02982929_04452 [Saccharopolyspora kobensis]|uniref:Uncharacterized protein n=2 Tax=Saccharopolyspora kobensis TaxID=146035 RepID=A0A1H6DIW7_9PSEU|nr:hypothetical protein SAMN02982929_04452 [Saccharopolyspora kobensis]SFD27475.1 hypothetical protein SAMN05216506_103339 [Saccharopolyspora kobensis]
MIMPNLAMFWVITAVAAVLVAFFVVHRVFSYRPQHAGGGDGALTVRYLIERVEAETSGGRHRLREPDSGGRGSPDVVVPTSGFSRNTEVFQRVLAGLQRL